MSNGVLQSAWKQASGRRKDRIGLWEETLHAALQEPGFLDEHAAELVPLVFYTLHAYAEKPDQRAVEKVLQAALASDAFLKPFTAALVKQEAAKLNKQAAYVLLRWSALVLQRLDPVGAKKAVTKLVECQAIFLEALALGGAPRGPVQLAVSRLLTTKPELCQIYLEVAKAKGSAALARALVGHGGPGKQEAVGQLLPVYVDRVLGAKERPPAAILDCWGVLVAAASLEQLSGTLLPAAARMGKRSRDPALFALARLLRSTTADLSGAPAAELFPTLLQQARHAKEPVRRLAIECVAALAPRVSDPQAVQQLLSAARALLDGTAEGKIKNAVERVSLCHVIAALAGVPGRGSSVSALATAAAEFLCTYYKEELNEEGKATAVAALGAWLPRCVPAALPEPAVARFEAGLKEKEALRRAHLRMLVATLRQSVEARGQVSALVPGLAKLVGEGVAKAASRLDGLLALLAAAYIASADMKADAALDKEKVWSSALKPDSVLLSPATASKLAADDAAMAAELVGVLLARHTGKLGPEASALAARSLVLLLLHHSGAVRKAAAGAAAEVAGTSGELAGLLVSALASWLAQPSEVTVMQDPADAEATIPLSTAHERYLGALLHCLPPAGSEVHLSTAAVGQVLLAAHHPLIAQARRRQHSSWHAVESRLKGDLDDAITGSPEELVQGLLAGVNSDDPQQQAAAYGALHSVMPHAADQLAPHLLHTLRPLLDSSAHDALTTREVRIYYTPAGKLSNEAPDGSIIPDEIYQAMLAKTGVAGTAAEASAPPPRGISSIPRLTHTPKPAAAAAVPRPAARASAAGARPTGGAGGKGTAKDAAAEARERQLAAEAQVRARVAGVRDTLSRGLSTLGASASGAPAWALPNLDQLSRLALPLLTSPLVGDGAAYCCVRQLALCLPGALGSHAGDVASALRVTRLTEQSAVPNYQHLAGQGSVRRAVHALRAATSAGPLPGPAYMFCFPILRAVLSCPEPTPLHEDALAVVALHVGPAAPSVPKPQSFALLYHVLEIIPAYRDRVQPLLRMLCTSTPADDVEGLTAAFQGLVAGPAHVRAAALHALFFAPAVANAAMPADDRLLGLAWLARCDPVDTNAEVAQGLWDEAGCSLPATFVPPLLEQLSSPHEEVRAAAAMALAEGSAEHPEAATQALAAALGGYAAKPPPARLGAGTLIEALAGGLGAEDLHKALDFLLGQGLADADGAIRDQMVAAGVALVDAQGREDFPRMLPLFESYLERRGSAQLGGLSETQYDHVRQGAVVFLGTLARHMDPANPKVKGVVQILVEVLTTPSESVQRSVSDCLPPLMQALQGDRGLVEGVVQTLLKRCLKGASYGDRRGAAFGLAGVVKGLGIGSLKGYGIMDALKAGVEDKHEANAREGALCAFECLSEKLGRLFEPYVIHILPMLLVCFGDAQQLVRDAANGAANAIMAQLSGQGVKLVLPALLKGLEDRTWRTKQGSIQLLGSMAHCAPKQLGTCLPTIVPRLGEVLSDPHPKVGQAARQALDEVGSVIRNPEVSALVPVLLSAIADPNANTRACLDTLLSTVFVNTVDAPSLALVVPVIHRGLRDRSGDVKKRAARIVGNLCALINDPKDMQPYVGLLLPELQGALIDPLPEVRATAAKALGSLVAGMGEEHFTDVLPWLLEHLRSEGSAVERSGAAQGLAEVLAVGQRGASSPVAAILADILAGCRARNAAVREGHLTLFRYLPRCMPEEFQRFLPEVLPCILDGLADEAEGVRDAALSAGRIAVELYANSALRLLLPAVEAGIINGNWRIRQSSVELLGDLLFKVAGTTGRIQQDLHNEEEEGISVEAHGQAIAESLGWDRRNEVLARVYMARSDVAYSVRSASLHVWKTVVTNTPKTLGEILPALMQQIISSLADPGEDRRQMAGRCLGELVRKMGDRILSQIVPILKQGMTAEEASTRQGVCNGLKEVLENATRHQIAEHLAELLPAIQTALCDADPATRQAAGGVFNVLFKSGGGSAMESVIPALLGGLDSDRHYAQALEGLRVVLSVRPQLLGAMIPRLIKPPIHSSGLRALGALAEVAGAAIHGHLQSIMPPLLTLTSSHPDVSPTIAAAHEALSHVVLSVQEDGLYLLVGEVVKGLEDPARRGGAAAAVTLFCRGSRLDFQEHVPTLITALVPLLAEDEQDVVAACWGALGAVTASIPKEMQPSFVRCLKDAVSAARDKERRKRRPAPLLVPGLCLPKALTPVLPIYLQGVLQGSSAELRELAAEGLGELVEVTGEDALKPFVVQITGPLIRIIGDRFPWEIKAAILHTLGLLIAKAGPNLKPFAPQLQTTFLKCLTDPAQKVRQKAANNLGELSRLALRLDQLVADLAASAVSAEPAYKDAYLTAVQGALLASGERLSGETLSKVAAALAQVLTAAGDDELLLGSAAAAQGALAKHCTPDELRSLLAAGPLNPAPSGRPGERLAAALAAAAVARHASDRLEQHGLLKPFVEAVRKLGRESRPEIKMAAARAAGRLILYEQDEGPLSTEVLPALVPLAVALLGPDQATDVQRQMMAVLRRVAGPALEPFYKDLVPSICSIVQDTAGSTKLAAERTLGRVLQLDVSTEPCAAFLASGTAGALARTMLNDAYMRRLSRLPPAEDEDAAYAF